MNRIDHQQYYERFAACPTNRLLATLGQKWTPVALNALANGPKRYSDLQRSIPSATQKMLTQTLRQLEQKGLVTRHVVGCKPPLIVEYELSSVGKSLLPVLSTLTNWAELNAVVDVCRPR